MSIESGLRKNKENIACGRLLDVAAITNKSLSQIVRLNDGCRTILRRTDFGLKIPR